MVFCGFTACVSLVCCCVDVVNVLMLLMCVLDFVLILLVCIRLPCLDWELHFLYSFPALHHQCVQAYGVFLVGVIIAHRLYDRQQAIFANIFDGPIAIWHCEFWVEDDSIHSKPKLRGLVYRAGVVSVVNQLRGRPACLLGV